MFANYPQASWRFDVTQPLPRRPITTQYRETDWEFVTRLLAEAGLAMASSTPRRPPRARHRRTPWWSSTGRPHCRTPNRPRCASTGSTRASAKTRSPTSPSNARPCPTRSRWPAGRPSGSRRSPPSPKPRPPARSVRWRSLKRPQLGSHAPAAHRQRGGIRMML
nr:contractile injection system protein, VgrG/Pvc8 family [Vulcaniibacterium tengchongense]